jgi:hypothetical protein
MRFFREMLDGSVDGDGVILVVALHACAALDQIALGALCTAVRCAGCGASSTCGQRGRPDRAGRRHRDLGSRRQEPIILQIPCGTSRTREEQDS